ncbi:MAG: aldo/keto reductase [Bryobacteraceae bacterium]
MDRVVPEVCLGCVTFGREIREDDSHRVLDYAFERGIRFFDTAEAYGGGASERVLGNWIRSRGVVREVTVATKALRNFTASHLPESLAASLERLHLDSVDIYFLHQPDPAVPLEETIDTLATLRNAGLLRRAGTSNFPLSLLEKAERLADLGAGVRLDITQPNYNLAVRGIEGPFLEFCRQRSVEIVTYSPLGAGFLTGKYTSGADAPLGTRFDVIPGHRDIYCTPENFAIVERLRQAAVRASRTMPHLAMQWVFEASAIDRVLIGARSTAHIDQAMAARQAAIESSVDGSARQLLEGD